MLGNIGRIEPQDEIKWYKKEKNKTALNNPPDRKVTEAATRLGDTLRYYQPA